MATLIVDNIPEDLKNNFRAECLRRGLHMRDVIMRLMAFELDEHISVVLYPKEEKEAGLKYQDKMIRTSDRRTK